ncbi:nucleophile aminohydrolase [Kockiozyma suomiensis]|uniref:nucleophile aminohydrolase n=1 Tax=Kockiozyma suomiensis TaxID=1337062 RepID=UPI0033434DD2
MSFVAIHLGAGFHSQKLAKRYETLCSEACRLGIRLLESENLNAQAAAAGICKFLEDDPLTNSGTGSNLTATGTIECDASIMSSEHNRGASVGCISGVKNPVLVAEKLLSVSFTPLSAGRVAPLFLVGEGARQFANDQQLELASLETLATKSAIIRYEYWSEILNSPGASSIANPSNDDDDLITDTVGVICVDLDGHIAVASSSGGIAMKQCGRIGPAALIGSGIWAARDAHSGSKVAVCTSGTGEDIISYNLASRCAQQLLNSDDEHQTVASLLSDFSQSPAIQLLPAAGGILAVKTELDPDNSRDILLQAFYGHTTKSMCAGFMASKWDSPKVSVSRTPNGRPSVLGTAVRIRH